jgi:hypothetical protein
VTVIKAANFVTLAVCVLAALVCLGSIPQASRDYPGEPEDLWLLLTYLLLLIPLGTLCLANALDGPTGNSIRSLQLMANLAAVFLLLVLLVIGRTDPAVPPIVAIFLLGPSAWGVGFASRL